MGEAGRKNRNQIILLWSFGRVSGVALFRGFMLLVFLQLLTDVPLRAESETSGKKGEGQASTTSKRSKTSILRHIEISGARYRAKADMVNTRFGNSMSTEAIPESLLIGIRGESELSYDTDLKGHEYELGIVFSFGHRLLFAFRKAAQTGGEFRDVDRHDPALRRLNNGVVYLDYQYPGTLKTWSDIMAPFDAQNEAWRIEYGGVSDGKKGAYFTGGLGVFMERYRFAMRTPFFSFVEYSEKSYQFKTGLNIYSRINYNGFDVYLRGGYNLTGGLDFYLTLRGEAMRVTLIRDWSNRALVSDASFAAHGVRGEAGVALTLSGAHRLSLEVSRGFRRGRLNGMGGALIPGVGSGGEKLEVKSELRTLMRYSLLWSP